MRQIGGMAKSALFKGICAVCVVQAGVFFGLYIISAHSNSSAASVSRNAVQTHVPVASKEKSVQKSANAIASPAAPPQNRSALSNLVDISFKNSGIVDQIKVALGDHVNKGQIVAVLDQRDAQLAISQARAALAALKAQYKRLLSGATTEEVNFAQTQIATARAALNNTQKNYDLTVQQQQTIVANDFTTLLNSSLAAVPLSNNSNAATISLTGAYASSTQGFYKIVLTQDGPNLAYALSGLESDSGSLTNANGSVAYGIPMRLGTLGLFFSFNLVKSSIPASVGDAWIINIPNMQGATYLRNYIAYQNDLQTQAKAVATAKAQIDTAQAALDQTQAQLALKQASARPEDVDVLQAQIDLAEAKLQGAQNNYDGNILKAPFAAVVTEINLTPGDISAGGKPVLQLLKLRP